MRRRDILASAVATGAALSFSAPAIAQGRRQLKLVTDWPEGSPGLQSSAERLAQRIGTASDGRISIQVLADQLPYPPVHIHRSAAGNEDVHQRTLLAALFYQRGS